ncbi:AAA family ATPase [Paenibacillus agilis]|uniref:AAA family ATPase n=1 Tax=Paenibacillus agilis TaxID=3020863 RepID=A0A559IEE0_9BACL|nr:AAA family ATPase [Paenibacillus agilis]TVX86022.1 AAA family ATPase [Paenibacillus agilis]
MKIVKTGEITRIFSDDLKTFDKIPVGNYKVCFHPMMGFYLEDADSFKINEKPYGKHPQKIAKVVSLYNNIERSVGVILSGKKGMGKSMFARLLSASFAETHEMPTIIVTEAYQGIVEFIESIKQECIVMFDEFEKVFDNSEKKEHQDKLLSLFDGVSQTKRLYVVTVNEIRRVNQYMINRPGRFHYHLQFNYPSAEEIELYLKDKLKPEYHNQITLVQRFSNRFDLNYDSLRAIAFELNLGYSFLETMEDLNISSTENESVRYDVTIHHSNGLVVTTEESINLMSALTRIGYHTSGDFASVMFSPLEVEIIDKEVFTAYSENVDFDVRYDNDNEVLTDESEITVDKIVFKKRVVGGAQYGKEFRDLV